MKAYTYILIYILSLFFAVDSFALAVNTHREINFYILNQPTTLATLDAQLKSYGLPEGVDKTFYARDSSKKNIIKELSVIEIIANGGISEDDPLRYGNHYHNPTQDW